MVQGVQIVCDRCQASPITAGYGLGPKDICLSCANKIMTMLEYIDNEYGNCTLMIQDQYDETPTTRGGNSNLTFMLQDQFTGRASSGAARTDGLITTNMQQDIYWQTGNGGARTKNTPSTQSRTTGGADDLNRRLDDMVRLREQPISSFGDVNEITGFDNGSAANSSLDAQFGGLLGDRTTQQPSSAVKPSPPCKSGPYLTRMIMSMFKTP